MREVYLLAEQGMVRCKWGKIPIDGTICSPGGRNKGTKKSYYTFPIAIYFKYGIEKKKGLLRGRM